MTITTSEQNQVTAHRIENDNFRQQDEAPKLILAGIIITWFIHACDEVMLDVKFYRGLV